MWEYWFGHWVERTMCGPWTDRLAFAYATAHVVTGIVYFLIPIVLGFIALRRKRLGHDRISITHDVSFAAFIFFCGLGHDLDALSVIWVNYRLHTLNAWCIAIASVFTLFFLPALIFPEAKPKSAEGRSAPSPDTDQNHGTLGKRI